MSHDFKPGDKVTWQYQRGGKGRIYSVDGQVVSFTVDRVKIRIWRSDGTAVGHRFVRPEHLRKSEERD